MRPEMSSRALSYTRVTRQPCNVFLLIYQNYIFKVKQNKICSENLQLSCGGGVAPTPSSCVGVAPTAFKLRGQLAPIAIRFPRP